MGKSVDWLDVLARHGAGHVRTHLLGGALTQVGTAAVVLPKEDRHAAHGNGNKRRAHSAVRPAGASTDAAAGDGEEAAAVARMAFAGHEDDGGGAGGVAGEDVREGWRSGGVVSPDHMLVGYDLGGVPSYDDALEQGRLILRHENTHDILARKVMVRLFHPDIRPRDPVPRGVRADPDTAWLVARYAGRWWVRPREARSEQAWQAIEDEAFESVIGECLHGFWAVKDKHQNIAPLAPTERTIKGVCKAMVNYVYIKSGEMPTWIDSSFMFDGPNQGLPTWATRVSFEPSPKKVGRHREVRSFIALQNGVLDVDALCDPDGARVVVTPPTPRFFNSACLPYDVPIDDLRRIFEGDGADADEAFERLCPAWVGFVRSCAEAACGTETEEAANWAQRAQEIAGYILSQWRELEVLFYFQGPRGTGKGTFCEGLQAMIGEAGVASMDADQLAGRFGLAPLIGRQMYLISELRFDRRFTNVPVFQDRLLKISSGDPIQVEEKFLSSDQTAAVRLGGAFVLTLNQEPNWPDDSAAMVRRLVVMPFVPYRGKRDDGLKARISREAAGIFCWALHGLRRLRVDRAAMPGVGGGPARFTPLVKAARMVKEIEEHMSPLTQWADECLLLGPGNETETGLLRDHFKAWAKEMGMSWHEDIADGDFGKKITAALGVEREGNVRRDRAKPYRVYLGVRPKLAYVQAGLGQKVVYEDEWERGGRMPRSVVNRCFDTDTKDDKCVGVVNVVWPGEELGKPYAD